MSIGLMMAVYFSTSCPVKPKVLRLTFSLVESTPRNRSFNRLSTKLPISPAIISSISTTPSHFPTPSTLPLRLITRILEESVSTRTLQISLNTTFEELVLCNNLLILRVLSRSCTLICLSFPGTPDRYLEKLTRHSFALSFIYMFS